MTVGQYRSAGITLTDAQVAKPQMDTAGNIKVTLSTTGASSSQVQGNVAAGVADAGNPVKVGALAQGSATWPTYTSGQRADLTTGLRGSLRIEEMVPGSASAYTSINNMADATSNTGWFRANVAFGHRFNGTTWDREKKPVSTSRIVSSAATTNATSGKASAGEVHSVIATNTTAAVKYLKLYNKASAPTVGTDTPVLTIALQPSNALSRIDFPNGGFYFSTGIAYALTGAAADADTTAVAAGDVVGLNIAYS